MTARRPIFANAGALKEVPDGDTLGAPLDPSVDNTPFVDKGTVNAGTVTFDRAEGLHQRVQVGGALTFAVDNWPAAGVHGALLLEIDNGGSATITWPTLTWVKADGTTQSSPTRTLQAAGTDWVMLWTRAAGAPAYARFL